MQGRQTPVKSVQPEMLRQPVLQLIASLDLASARGESPLRREAGALGTNRVEAPDVCDVLVYRELRFEWQLERGQTAASPGAGYEGHVAVEDRMLFLSFFLSRDLSGRGAREAAVEVLGHGLRRQALPRRQAVPCRDRVRVPVRGPWPPASSPQAKGAERIRPPIPPPSNINAPPSYRCPETSLSTRPRTLSHLSLCFSSPPSDHLCLQTPVARSAPPIFLLSNLADRISHEPVPPFPPPCSNLANSHTLLVVYAFADSLI